MRTAARAPEYPYPQSLVPEVARTIWIQNAIGNGATKLWAQEAWDDMGGSEPNDERALLEVRVGESLRSAPPVGSFDELVVSVTPSVI